jgi:replicative DNA helicase
VYDHKTPPADANAERAVIGAALRDPDIIPDVCEVLGADSFYEDRHQRVWRSILSLSADGKPVDLVTLHDRLRAAGWAGGRGRRRVPRRTVGRGRDRGERGAPRGLVRDHATRRALIHAANEILRDAYSVVGSGDELLALAERRVFDLAESGAAGGKLVSAAEMARGRARAD